MMIHPKVQSIVDQYLNPVVFVEDPEVATKQVDLLSRPGHWAELLSRQWSIPKSIWAGSRSKHMVNSSKQHDGWRTNLHNSLRSHKDEPLTPFIRIYSRLEGGGGICFSCCSRAGVDMSLKDAARVSVKATRDITRILEKTPINTDQQGSTTDYEPYRPWGTYPSFLFFLGHYQ